MESAARLHERLRHRRRVHDIDRQSKSFDSVHDSHGARRRSRDAGNGEAEPVSETRRPMNRREAVKTTGVLLSGVLITSAGLTACKGSSDNMGSGVLSAEDQALVEEIADTLLPMTANSPGPRRPEAGPASTSCRPIVGSLPSKNASFPAL